jgi:hypothetical protein
MLLLLLLPATLAAQVAALKLLDRDDDIEKYAWFSLHTFDWLGKPLSAAAHRCRRSASGAPPA